MKKALTIAISSVIASAMSLFAFATSAETVDVSGVVTALGAFNTSNLLSVIVAGLGIAVPLVLLWFGFRWIYSKAKGALKRGS